MFWNYTEKICHFYLEGLAPKEMNLDLLQGWECGGERGKDEDSALKQRGMAQTLRPGNGRNGEDVLEF